MGKFLTSHSRIEQLDIPGKWKLIDNQLYKDDDGIIYLCPRNLITDGFTIPNILAAIAGGKMQWDTRASSEHDFECYYHLVLIVNMTEYELRRDGYLHIHNDLQVCENIPLEFLTLKTTTFNETNNRFLRMLQSLNSISSWRAKLLRFGVNFNVGWIIEPHIFDEDYIYEVDYGLLG